MFSPQPMTEVELIVPASDILPVTKTIRGQGIFHQLDGSSLSVTQVAAGGTTNGNTADAALQGTVSWQEQSAAYIALERRIQTMIQVLDLDEGRPPETELEDMIQIDPAREVVEGVEQDVKRITDQLARENKHLEQLNSHIKELEPITSIDLDVNDFRKSAFLFSVLGTIPAGNIDRLHASLMRVPYVFLPLQQDPQKALVWLAGSPDNADILERAARSAYLVPMKLPEGYQGRPSQVLKTLQVDVAADQQTIALRKKDLTQLRDSHRETLQTLLWNIRSSRMIADAILRYGRLTFTYIIVGWVPSAKLADLTNKIKLVSKESIVTAMPQTQPDYEAIPVVLSDNKILKLFQLVVMAYGRPRYDEIDPTVLIAITFPVLFGAMFGDVGQGLILAVLGWLIAKRKIKALDSLRSLGGLISMCGVIATIFGFLYGSFFGVENVLPALWIRPMENIMEILMVAIGGGVVLLSFGMLVGMYNAWRKRDWSKLFFDRNGLAGLVLYWSLLVLVVPTFGVSLAIPSVPFVILAGISAVLILFSEVLKHLVDGHRPLVEEGWGTYAIQAFFELFETFIGFLSNSLSYVRVGAFAVAHAGLSSVIFILADMISVNHGFGYWVTVVLGNLFIVGFEGLIVGIQTMRLEYYEFFSKFFTGGGKRYEPLGRLTGD
jgi:V/A-type H+/Na+-transporting ATPase subunit I